MDLKFFSKKQDDFEYFWSLVIGKMTVDAALWRVVGEAVEIVGKSEGISWQEGDVNSLVQACDDALSASSSSLPDDVKEPNRVVFGLPSSWSENGNIKADNLGILKKLSESLELKPSGFVVVPEAIIHLLKSREGAPPNAILIRVDENEFNIALTENGKVLGIADVARSISPGADIAEGLARFPKSAQYPTRILLYDHKDSQLDEVKQSVIDTSWDEHGISFLHTPKVQILSSDTGVDAVSLAGGAEVGGAKFLKSVGTEPALNDISEQEVSSKEGQGSVVQTLSEESVAPEVEHESNLKEISPSDLGFVSGDVRDALPPDEVNLQAPSQLQTGEIRADERFQPESTNASSGGSLLGKLKTKVFGLRFPSLPSFSAPGGRTGMILVLSLLFLIGGFVGAYWFLPRAQIEVYVAPQRIEKTLAFKIDSELASIDVERKALPGRFVETKVLGDKTAATTGTRLIGEKATGEVKIYQVGEEIILPAGTVLTSSDGLEFVLDSEVEVPEGSSSANPGVSSPVGVTAADIGTEYNLAAGTEFSIGNLSSSTTSAKNDSEFSGGTSREVSAVTEADRSNIEKLLQEELLIKGKDGIAGSLRDEEVIVDGYFDFKVLERNFSNSVNDESENISLSMSGDVEYLALSLEQMRELILADIANEVPDNYALPKEQLNVEIAKSSKEEIVANVSANLLPKVNVDEIKANIAGKTEDAARSYLTSISGFERAQIVFGFRFPGPLGNLPRRLGNISVELVGSR